MRRVLFSDDGNALLSGAEESLKVWGWEPVRCFEQAEVRWSRLADMCIGPQQQLLAVANQGDGRDCATGSLDVYTYDRAARRFALLQTLRAGCATYAAAFRAPSGRLRLAVAIEREGADERNESSYKVASPVYEYSHRRAVE